MEAVFISRHKVPEGATLALPDYFTGEEWEEFVKFINLAQLTIRGKVKKPLPYNEEVVDKIVGYITIQQDEEGE